MEIAFIVVLGCAFHQAWFGNADFLGAIFPMSLAVLVLTHAARRLVAEKDRHPLALRHSSPGAAALCVAAAFLPLLLAQLLNNRSETGWLLAWAVLSSLSVFVMRALIRKSGWGLADGGVALLGDTEEAHRLASSFGGQARSPVVASLPYTAGADIPALREMVEDGRVETVVLAGIPQAEICAILDRIAELPIAIYAYQDARATHAPISEVVELVPNLLVGPAGLTKRALDLVGGIVALVAFGPLILVAALLVKLESPGPAFFRQVRFGCGGRAMEIWKLRSMYIDQGDATGEVRTRAADPRVTRVGRVLRRLSIDELPQLFNVLRGDMSLVGPRPHAVRMKVEGEYYHRVVASYPVRHRVKPGITGWAQVNGSRGEVDTLPKAFRRVSLDLWYISNWSLALDLKILALTAMGRFATLKAD
ncbi:exopolysaccharide biosynthesis polyprenyl glycosylphosphotransferase [Roseomonas sp. E05]|uniref:exopolysaccharide biosynthesis polyprenyl glycosylphosphotransferase n=1 Tax=Roseomonas sp. E05 TaxID=3046310 RepID=UPI0024B9523D|nr:exopolysaccharide biosynthesis polyprenyl glycosylphosphotransferase [Roseomonas sp. E05]MDJ0391470.1 exopolysaccharide biosynthesis polyprenyl glycosylphosphotransferase [Roseomonas sp. E05]